MMCRVHPLLVLPGAGEKTRRRRPLEQRRTESISSRAMAFGLSPRVGEQRFPEGTVHSP